MKAVIFAGHGGNEVVDVVERPDPTPGDDEVVVAVRFAGLNPADLQQRAGRYPAPRGTVADIPGLEVAGTVVDLGRGVTEWRHGDRVMGLVGGGGLASRVIAHRRHLTRVPDALDDLGAAALPEAFITAHDALRTQADLTMGETLLVQGANGGVGSAAVSLGVAAGARVLGVCRSAQGRAFVASLGGEPVDAAGWPDAVRRLLEGGAGTGASAPAPGVDVILELVGAPNIPDDIDVLRDRGRIVVIGLGGGADAKLPLGRLLQRRASVRASGLRYRSMEDKALAVRAFEREVMPLFERAVLRPAVDRTFPVDDAREAFDHLESGSKRGKVLLDLG